MATRLRHTRPQQIANGGAAHIVRMRPAIVSHADENAPNDSIRRFLNPLNHANPFGV